MHLSSFALFLVQAALILAASQVLSVLAKHLRQPAVIAEMFAGIMLGPSCLGRLWPGAFEALFPSSSMPFLSSVGQIGLTIFMFVVGLELDVDLLRKRSHSSVLISHSSIAVPFLLGGVLGLYLYPRVSLPNVPFVSFLLFMGIASSVTAFPVLARILADRGLTQTTIGAVAITCAAVDDVTAWSLLAFVLAVARSTGWESGVQTIGMTIVFILVMIFIVRPVLRRFADQLGGSRVLLLGVLACSLTTEVIGVHAVFGAFVLGAVMPRNERQRVSGQQFAALISFLLPIFFAYSGLRTRLTLITTAESLWMCLLITLCACVGKFGGSAVAARITRLSWREASAIGILMNTRGLMELVVLNIGLDIGVISPTLFAMMVVMALVTTLMTTPLLQWLGPIASESALSSGGCSTPAIPEGESPIATAVVR